MRHFFILCLCFSFFSCRKSNPITNTDIRTYREILSDHEWNLTMEMRVNYFSSGNDTFDLLAGRDSCTSAYIYFVGDSSNIIGQESFEWMVSNPCSGGHTTTNTIMMIDTAQGMDVIWVGWFAGMYELQKLDDYYFEYTQLYIGSAADSVRVFVKYKAVN